MFGVQRNGTLCTYKLFACTQSLLTPVRDRTIVDGWVGGWVGWWGGAVMTNYELRNSQLSTPKRHSLQAMSLQSNRNITLYALCCFMSCKRGEGRVLKGPLQNASWPPSRSTSWMIHVWYPALRLWRVTALHVIARNTHMLLQPPPRTGIPYFPYSPEQWPVQWVLRTIAQK